MIYLAVACLAFDADLPFRKFDDRAKAQAFVDKCNAYAGERSKHPARGYAYASSFELREVPIAGALTREEIARAFDVPVELLK